MVPLIVPLGMFFAFVLVVQLLARLASNISLNRTMREALRSDPASVPVLAGKLDAGQPWGDALVGWIFIAFTIGLILMGLMEPDAEERREIFQAAVVPLVVGAVVLFHVRRSKQASPPPAVVRRTPPAATRKPARSRPKAA